MVDPATNAAPTPPPPTPSEAPTPPGQLAGLATQKERDAEAASQPPVVVSSIVKSHMELVQVAPRFQALDFILADRPIGHDDDEPTIRQPPVRSDGTALMEEESGAKESTEPPVFGKTFIELLSEVQASPDELEAALEERMAVCVDGRWRGVDSSYLGTLLELILLTVVEQGWSLEAVPAVPAGEALAPHGYLPEVTEYCLKRFSKPVLVNSGKKEIEGAEAMQVESRDGVYALHAEAVCRHFGIKLLQERNRWESVGEFEYEWKKVIPEGMVPRMELLRGEAVLEAEGGSGVERLSVGELPRDAPGRFKRLFSIRPKWEFHILEPYIEDLPGPGETMEMLLLKYARMSQQRPTDPITYSAR